MATKTKAAAAAEKEDAKENGIPDSSLTSAVTTDLPADGKDGAYEASEPDTPAEKASIGLIKVDGIDFRYVGVAPARDKDAQTDAGMNITPQNSTFTAIANVPFDPSIRVKDPKSGKFYFPEGCTSWADCSLDGSYLIEREK